METISGGTDRVQEEKWWLKKARLQQVDPYNLGELYPWWIPWPDGSIRFDPAKYVSEDYHSTRKLFTIASNPQERFDDPFDLDNLRIIDPEDVRRAFEKIKTESAEKPDKPAVIFVGHGGTISMSEDEYGRDIPKFNPEQLLKKMGPDKEQSIAYSCFNMPTMIDSSQNEIDYIADMVIAMSWLYRELEKYDKERKTNILDRFGGFIACHGTDTLCQSQAYLSVMLGSNCPFNVYFVAAQKTTEHKPRTDAYDNFDTALQAAEEFSGRFKSTGIHGLCVGGVCKQKVTKGVFNGLTSRKVSDKTEWIVEEHHSNGPIWSLENLGDDGEQGMNLSFNEALQEAHRSGINREFQPLILRGHSDILTITPDIGNNPEIIEKIVSTSWPKAILLTTFGSYTMNRKIVDAVFKGLLGRLSWPPIFATNPFPVGSTKNDYPDATYLASRGIIPLKMLGHAAAAKLEWAFKVFEDDRESRWQVIKFMTENHFRGEQLVAPRSDEYTRDVCKKSLCFPQNDPDRILIYALNYPEFRYLVMTVRERINIFFRKFIIEWLQNEDVKKKLEAHGYHSPEDKTVKKCIDDTMEKVVAVMMKNAIRDSIDEDKKDKLTVYGLDEVKVEVSAYTALYNLFDKGINNIIDALFDVKDKDMKPLLHASTEDIENSREILADLVVSVRTSVLAVLGFFKRDSIPTIGQPAEYEISKEKFEGHTVPWDKVVQEFGLKKSE